MSTPSEWARLNNERLRELTSENESRAAERLREATAQRKELDRADAASQAATPPPKPEGPTLGNDGLYRHPNGHVLTGPELLNFGFSQRAEQSRQQSEQAMRTAMEREQIVRGNDGLFPHADGRELRGDELLKFAVRAQQKSPQPQEEIPAPQRGGDGIWRDGYGRELRGAELLRLGLQQRGGAA